MIVLRALLLSAVLCRAVAGLPSDDNDQPIRHLRRGGVAATSSYGVVRNLGRGKARKGQGRKKEKKRSGTDRSGKGRERKKGQAHGIFKQKKGRARGIHKGGNPVGSYDYSDTSFDGTDLVTEDSADMPITTSGSGKGKGHGRNKGKKGRALFMERKRQWL